MEITKTLEKEVIMAYEAYFDNYINGNVEAITIMLDEEYNQIGSAESEVFFNKKDAVKFLYDTIDQVAGKTEIRNRILNVERIEDLILVTDLFDIYALIESDWKFYSKFRASTLMHKKKDGWKFIHQHSSMPDTRTDGGENIAIEKIAEENQELREAVKRRTIELENKNQELKIEAALERVRVRTMGMQSSEDLANVATVLFDQLRLLGGELFSCGIVLCDENKNEVEQWHSIPGAGMIDPFFVPHNLDYIHQYRYDQWKLETDLFSIEIPEDVIAQHFDTMLALPSVKAVWEGITAKGLALPEIPTWEIDYGASFQYGYLLISALQPFEEARILPRFATVFEQTYTRFLDLQKAESRAKEAQIEAALERVRASAMAMHKSEDLTSSVSIVFSELDQLGFNTIRCGIGIFNDKSRNVNVWTASSKEVQLSGDEVLEGHPLLEGIYNAWQNQVEYSYVLKGKALLDYYEVVAESNLPVSGPEINNENVTQFYHVVNFSAGGLFAFRESEFSDEVKQLMKRFGDVFNLAFTRHLDLKKAEAQAKESQIEVALERVRARSMAMHKSGELADLSYELVKQVQALGVATWFCAFNIYDEDQNGSLEWGSNAEGTYPNYRTPREGIFLRYYEAGQRGEILLINDIVENECAAHYKYLCSLPGVGEQLLKMKDAGIQFPTSQIDHVAYFKYGYIIFITYEPAPEAHDVFKRFAKVFEQTYTRFLDLEKAEAQAREAQIEAALDKVRARTMAMQKSSELAQTAAHLFEQLNDLGIKPYRCSIAIVDVKSVSCRLWSTTNSGNVIPTGSALPLTEYSVMQNMYDGWKTQQSNHVIKLAGEERLAWIKYISKYLPFDEYKPQNIKKEFLLKEAAFFSNFYFKQGFFTIHTSEKLKEDELQVIQRFAKVFQQTYTRFLDLENAETQNKLIQAENERKTQELEEARELQLAMLPKELPQLPNIEIAVYMKTATEVGGDYYDFHVGDNGILTGVIGDATGHGMKAGTIVTITKSLFNNLAPDENILSTFSKISRVIKDMKFRQLSMCLLMFKIEDNIISISSAAMPPALIYRTKKNIVEEFELRGMPLGAMNNFPYKLVETKLHKGDTILLMSDGFPELMNEEKVMYGYERTKSIFYSLGEKTPEEIVEQLKNSASGWVNDKDPDDDVTFVVIKVK